MKKACLKIISFVLSMVLLLSLCAMGSVQAVIDFETMIKDGEIYDAMYEFLKQFDGLDLKSITIQTKWKAEKKQEMFIQQSSR